MCDVIYVMNVERVERSVLAGQTGAEVVEAVRQLDEQLAADPTISTAAAKLREWGVR